MPRVIFHVDMDCFFAACEEKRRPELKGKPVVIGGREGRGVVSTANYKAREFGIKSAMPVSKAESLCKDAIFILPDMKYYKEMSNKIMVILSSFASKFEPVSVDEAYLDVTNKITINLSPRILAAKIKKEIYNKTKLSCSIGIAKNKSIAKIASDIEKPDGVTEVKDSRNFLRDLPVRKISGIGKVTQESLTNLGIKTIGDLSDKDRQWLIEKLGKYGLRLWLIANGLENEEVSPRESSESFSTERTYSKDIEDIDIITESIEDMSKRVSKELKEDRYNSKTVSVKIRYEDFETITRAKTLGFYFNDYKTIFEESLKLFKDNYDKNRKVRLIGVRCSNLSKLVEKQTRLTDWF